MKIITLAIVAGLTFFASAQKPIEEEISERINNIQSCNFESIYKQIMPFKKNKHTKGWDRFNKKL